MAPWTSGEAAKGRESGLKITGYGKVEEMAYLSGNNKVISKP